MHKSKQKCCFPLLTLAMKKHKILGFVYLFEGFSIIIIFIIIYWAHKQGPNTTKQAWAYLQSQYSADHICSTLVMTDEGEMASHMDLFLLLPRVCTTPSPIHQKLILQSSQSQSCLACCVPRQVWFSLTEPPTPQRTHSKITPVSLELRDINDMQGF